MKILFLTQYFPPEVGAPQNRIFELAKLLVKKGHSVTVLTGMPNYPANEIFERYRGKLISQETMDDIRVIRTWLYVSKNSGFIPRLMNYFSFTISSVLFGGFIIKQQDIVITESPPLFLGMSGYIMSKLKKAKFVFNISDLWPESAIKLGVLHNKLLIKLSTWLEEFCYKKSALITGQTQGINEDINKRGFKNTYLLTNGVDTNLFRSQNQNDEVQTELGVKNKFSVCYAGIIGIAQGLDVILETAHILREYDNIEFLMIGEGPEKARLLDKARRMQLANVRFIALQPKSKMPSLIASMSATIVPLKKIDLFKGALPSKMFEALASELPIILAVDGEAKKLIERSGGGMAVEPENAVEIANAVLKLYNDPKFKAEMGKKGREYVIKNYSRDTIVDNFEKKLLELI